MTLLEFVRQFADPDPWSVPVPVWYERVNSSSSLPDGYPFLVSEELRALHLEELAEVFGPMTEPDPVEPAEPDGKAAAATADELSIRVGAVLKRRRIARRIKLREAARATGIHASTLCRMEQGRRPISLDEMNRLAAFLEYRLEALIHGAVSLDLDALRS